MLVYFYLYCFGLINVLISYLDKKYDRTTFIFYGCSLLFFAALRYGIGTDYFAYVDIYNESLKKSGRIEFGYIVLNKLLKYLHCPVEVLFFFTCLIVLLNYYKAFKTLDINRTLGLFVFYCFFYLVNIYNLVRHGIAVSFLLLGLSYLVKDKTKKASVCILLACCFHYISILIGLMIIFYRLIKKRIKLNLFSIVAITFFLFFIVQRLIIFISGLPSSNIFFSILKLYFSIENQNAIGIGTLLNIFLLVFFLIIRKKIEVNNKIFQSFLDFFILYFITLFVFWSIPTITERVTSFFYQSIIILITIVISDSIMKKKYLNIICILSITTIILFKYIFAREVSGDFAFMPYEIAHIK